MYCSVPLRAFFLLSTGIIGIMQQWLTAVRNAGSRAAAFAMLINNPEREQHSTHTRANVNSMISIQSPDPLTARVLNLPPTVIVTTSLCLPPLRTLSGFLLSLALPVPRTGLKSGRGSPPQWSKLLRNSQEAQDSVTCSCVWTLTRVLAFGRSRLSVEWS